MTEGEPTPEEDAAFEELLKPRDDLRLPDEGGPPIDYTLVQRMALRDESVSEEMRRCFFKLIVAYRSWDQAYLDALKEAIKAEN